MKDDLNIRKKALRSIQAMTAGALIFAGVYCTIGNEPEPNSNLQNLDDSDTTANAEADAGTEADAGADDTDRYADADIITDTGNDAEELCNAELATGTCHASCTIDNDIDCCQEANHCWRVGKCWVGGCAVPGPFVPPTMSA